MTDTQMKYLENKVRQVEDDDLRSVLTIILARIDYLERLCSELHWERKQK